MKKTSLALLLAATLVAAFLVTVATKVAAQKAFPGFIATLADYHGCDPEDPSKNCAPSDFHTIRELPDGEKSQDMVVPDMVAQHMLAITTKTQSIHSFPNLLKWYALPNSRVDVFASDNGTNCEKQANLVQWNVGPATFVKTQIVGGFPSYEYGRVRATVNGTQLHTWSWFFPDVGCAELQTTTEFSGTTTYQKLTSLRPGFADYSSLIPPGEESSPMEIAHLTYVQSRTAGAFAVTSDAAETEWKRKLADIGDSSLADRRRAQANWERLKSRGARPR